LTEDHGSRGAGIERMVTPHSHVVAGVHLRAALADQNASGGNHLTAEALDAQTLGLRIAAVAGTAACFLVCHLAEPRMLRGYRWSRCGFRCTAAGAPASCDSACAAAS